jgi:AAA domain, putative AbiEii toxin, Type IV TA system
MVLDPDKSKTVARVLDNILDANAVERSEFVGIVTLEALSERVAALTPAHEPGDEAEEPEPRAYLKHLQTELQGRSDRQELLDGTAEVLWSRVPRFFYFSNYSTLPGRADLREIAADPTQPAEDDMQTARALLSLAATTPEMLQQEDYELRKAELEAVSNDLTRQVREYWHQSEDLEVVIDVDKVTEDLPNGQTAVARFLDIRVRDRRHGYTNNFGQRSSGFQWFFSFLAAFSEFEELDRPVIVLLDEPGLSLHGKAQSDFLRFIEERLAPSVQVLYTTHSPFMVDPARLERVRIVEDKGVDRGSVTTEDVLSVDADSLFPLQAALGYDVAQSLFIGPDNILVEGTSDWTYLTIISGHLRSLGREGLDERWRILPTGGAQNIPAFVALLGRHLEVTVLVDAGTQGMQRLQALATKGLLAANRLVTVAEITGTSTADIEDVFTPEDYIKLYNKAFNRRLTAKGLPPGDRVIDRLARKTNEASFDHGQPADVLLRERDTILPDLSAETLDRFEALLKRLNATAPS